MTQEESENSKKRLGTLAIIGIAIGVGCFIFAGLGALNTAYDGDWALRISGARVELPTNYEVCIGLIAAGLLFVLLSLFGSFVLRRFEAAKGKPLIRIAIVLLAVGLLVVGGRGLQIFALTQTYGSMLAYYATDGDLEDVRAELAKGPDREALDRAVGRAAQYDNVGALRLLLEAGADFRQLGRPAEQRRCVLSGTGPEFVSTAIEHGASPSTCPQSEALIWSVVTSSQPDARSAEVVRLLAAAGWSAVASPEHSQDSPAALAERRGKTATLAALTALSQPAAP